MTCPPPRHPPRANARSRPPEPRADNEPRPGCERQPRGEHLREAEAPASGTSGWKACNRNPSDAGFTLVEVAAGLVLGSIGLALVMAFLLVAARQSARWQEGVEAAAALHVLRTRLASDLRVADTLWTDPDGVTIAHGHRRTRYAVRSDTLYRDGRRVLPGAVRAGTLSTYAWGSGERSTAHRCSSGSARLGSGGGGLSVRLPESAALVAVQLPIAVRSRADTLLVCAWSRRGSFAVRAVPPLLPAP